MRNRLSNKYMSLFKSNSERKVINNLENKNEKITLNVLIVSGSKGFQGIKYIKDVLALKSSSPQSESSREAKLNYNNSEIKFDFSALSIKEGEETSVPIVPGGYQLLLFFPDYKEDIENFFAEIFPNYQTHFPYNFQIMFAPKNLELLTIIKNYIFEKQNERRVNDNSMNLDALSYRNMQILLTNLGNSPLTDPESECLNNSKLNSLQKISLNKIYKQYKEPLTMFQMSCILPFNTQKEKREILNALEKYLCKDVANLIFQYDPRFYAEEKGHSKQYVFSYLEELLPKVLINIVLEYVYKTSNLKEIQIEEDNLDRAFKLRLEEIEPLVDKGIVKKP